MKQRSTKRAQKRRGISTLWVIILLPLLLPLFCFVVDIANLWNARAELENALEASVLAAVKEWGDSDVGSTFNARKIGIDFASANHCGGEPVTTSSNYDANNFPNENGYHYGNFLFGTLIDNGQASLFNADLSPAEELGLDNPNSIRHPAVCAQATQAVPSLCCQFCGVKLDTFSISAKAVAIYDQGSRRARLVSVEPENFISH